MPRRPKDQGTAFETWLVRQARALGSVEADRLPLRGTHGEPDLHVTPAGKRDYTDAIPVVAWKRLVKATGKKKRVPDGEPIVVVLGWENFLALYELALTSDADLPPRLMVQAKATERLNVTRELGKLRTALNLLF